MKKFLLPLLFVCVAQVKAQTDVATKLLIADADKNMAVNIIPNPSNGNFIIETNNNQKKSMFFLFDANGKLVLNQFISESKMSIDVSNLREGAYSLNLVSNEGTVTKKLVIAK
jgi:hypothetical protein